MLNKYFIIVLVILSSAVLFAQTPQPPEIKPPSFASPNAASLGKYGDIPVSYHTGVPNINLPLYTLSEGSLSHQISISYHSSGIRVDEVASSVGLGWALNAGGMISRTVKGAPDEGRTEFQGTTSTLAGWGYYKDGGIPPAIEYCANNYGTTYHGGVAVSNTPYANSRFHGVNGPCHPTLSLPCSSGTSCMDFFLGAAYGNVDTESDVYTFNFDGYNGKFFFGPNRSIQTIPTSDLLIEPNGSNLSTWKITTPDGKKFFFGYNNSKENTYNVPDAQGVSGDRHLTNTTWYLTRIESPNGEDWISFQYQSEDYGYASRSGHSLTVLSPGVSGSYLNASQTLTQTVVKGKRLSLIQTKSGQTEVLFSPGQVRTDLNKIHDVYGTVYYNQVNDQARTIGSIQIATTGYSPHFVFTYDYFQSAPCSTASCTGFTSSIDASRLRLTSIMELGKPPHSFVYNSTPIARRYSLARDLWGYYNGQDANDGLVPHGAQVGSMVFTSGDVRDVSEVHNRAGILEEIHYPTGGYTKFEYECHRIPSGNGDKLIGGLRVSRITDKSQAQIIKERQINYDYGNLYEAEPNFITQPNQNPNKIPAHDYGIFFSADPVSYMSSFHGYHIGYSVVTEKQIGNGETKYYYFNTPPTLWGVTYPYFPSIPAISNGITGELQQKDTYNVTGMGIASESRQLSGPTYYQFSTNAYTVVLASCIPAPQGQTNACDPNGSYHLYRKYSINADRSYLLSETKMLDGLISSKSYEYGPNFSHRTNFPTSVTTTQSDGKVNRTEYDYPNQSNAPTEMWATSSAPVPGKYMIGVPIKIRELVDGKLVRTISNTFNVLGNDKKILLTTKEEKPTGNGEIVLETYEYNSDGRLVQINKPSGVSESFVWGYNGMLPIAKVTNAKVNQVFYNGFELSGSPGPLGCAKTGSPNGCHYGSTYTVPLPLSDGTYKVSYWEKLNSSNVFQLMEQTIVKSGGSPSTLVIGSTTSAVDDVRVYPMDAQMTTYTYLLGTGLSSVTDANQVSSFYQYDLSGRLVSIKDEKGNIIKTYQYNYQN